MKIGIITPPFMGHINPTLSIGKELIDRGHRVCWLSLLDHIGEIVPKGGEYIKFEAPKSQNVPDLAFGMEGLGDLYKEIFIPLNWYMYEIMKPIIRNGDFDLIITDHQAFSGGVLAYEFNIPFVTSVTAPAAVVPSADFPRVIDYERNQIVQFQKSAGVGLSVPLVCSSPLTLIYATADFLQYDNFPDTYKFVGPASKERFEYDFDFSKIDALDITVPRILITLGSILRFEIDVLDKIINAFKDERVHIILNADPLIKTIWPDNFLVYAYIPQLKMLEKVDAVICHAGYNTVSEALSCGLPLITLPIVNDQSYVATKVKNCGAGIRLKYRRLKSEHLKEGLQQLLSNPSYRKSATKIKESFNSAGGALRAAELIEDFMCHHVIVSN